MTRALAVLILLTAGAAHAADKLEVLEDKARETAPGRTEVDRWHKRLTKLVGKPTVPLVNIWNTWTHETLVLDPAIDSATFGSLLRCHFTNLPAPMDMRLLTVLAGAATRFNAQRIVIVSGFRAPKYNLMLRKKGREVARDSQHTYGHAVDFRIDGVPTARLAEFVRSLRLGGAGYYPDSAFVHADVGPVRTWAGR